MIVSAVVALSENRAIGLKGQIPWKISIDLKRFRAITSGHVVIMGRKTYESIGKPLPNRRNIVISRQKDLGSQPAFVGVEVHASLHAALDAVSGEQQVFIIGGGEIYREALPLYDRIYETRVHAVIEGDAVFPELPQGEFREARREEGSEGEWKFTFIDWERVRR
jgi:dihydrofolate reductase